MSVTKDRRLDFYFENKLIMSATAKDFIKMGIIESRDSKKISKEEDVLLELGDRFPLIDFPKEGNSMIVRIVKMEIGERFADGDFIKYFLEEYKSK